MKNHTLTFHKEQPVCGKRVTLNVLRILAIIAIILALIVGLGGCAITAEFGYISERGNRYALSGGSNGVALKADIDHTRELPRDRGYRK